MVTSSLLVLGDLKGGKLRVENRATLDRWIAAQPDGASFRATFELTDTSKRGRLVTFYRWVLLPQFAEHCGNSVKAQHQDIWLTVTACVNARLERDIDIDADLKPLSDFALSNYVQDAVRLAADQGCVLTERP